MRRYTSNELITASFILALGVLFPLIFHIFGIAGPIFLPMHVPVFIAGVLLVPELAILVGVLSPFLSSLLTGMPLLFPIAIIMMFELGAYGWLTSKLIRSYHQKVITSLVIAMVCGRALAALIAYLLVRLFQIELNPLLYIKGAIITGLPGILLQLILLPVLVRAIQKMTLNRY